MPKIIQYRNRCIGCNACVEQAPDFWEISSSDGKSNLKQGIQKKDVWIRIITADDLEKNEHAARDCPMRIIKIEK